MRACMDCGGAVAMGATRDLCRNCYESRRYFKTLPPAHDPCAGRAEDLAWMGRHGETRDGAAARLGISLGALERWCERNAPHLYDQLKANERAHGTGARRGHVEMRIT